jgi:Flp pilus assembly protein TadB
VSKRRKERERRHRIAHAEVVPRDDREPRPERAPSKAKAAKATGSASARRKPVPAPSLQRSLKRAALVFVVLTALIYVVDGGKHSIAADGLQAILGAAFFVPFDYMLTRVMYRRLGSRVNP